MVCEKLEKNEQINPFEIDIGEHCEDHNSADSFASYDIDKLFPIYDADELKQSYSCVREFAKIAIENRFCNYCRFKFIGNYSKNSCTCEQYEKNKDLINCARIAADKILDYHKAYILKWASQIEKELEGDSEYARLNRKAREVMGNRLARYNAENYSINVTKTNIRFKKLNLVKNSLKKWISRVKKWFITSYWIWYFKTPKTKKVKSIPLFVATPEEIKSKSCGGNCYLRTKGGSVVVVPCGILDKIKKQYPGSEIVEPLIKD